MGFLHDVGYEKSPDTSHPNVGGSMVDAFLKYPEMLEAIRHHGKKLENLNKVDTILNTADLTVSYNGKPCTVHERLEGIKERYDDDSEHYKNAMLLGETLGFSINYKRGRFMF